MFLMYVDESGDPGMTGSPSRGFALTGLVVHELAWELVLQKLIAFRQRMKAIYGLRLRDEIHAGCMITRPSKPLALIPRNDRLAIIRAMCDELAQISEINLINVLVDKSKHGADYDAYSRAWEVLFQRFENTIDRSNFRGPKNSADKGIMLCDHTDEKKLRNLLRRMRHYNPIPHQPQYGFGTRNLVITKLIEDPIMRDSRHSYFVQACDVAAYVLYQHHFPCGYMKKTGGKSYFKRLSPVLCRVASRTDIYGIVRL
ncbi:MAG: DUF3800 domain-containing protein [Candidatus Hydrogenedentes bacterium]|nr:DUF3800 domain-containing protein [Candidatus Hydrogenedentota bacterium]